MDKKVLSEINRSREIMGLGQLLIKEFVEETSGTILTEQEVENMDTDVLVPSIFQDNRPKFWEYLKKHDFNDMKYGDSQMSFAKAIAYAYNKIYGEELSLDSLHLYKPQMFKGHMMDQVSKRMHAFGGTDLMVLSNAPGSSEYKVTMTFAPLKWRDTQVSLDEALLKINQYNIANAGQVQIVKIVIKSDTTEKWTGNKRRNTVKATSLVNRLETEQNKGALVLFSSDFEVTTLDQGEGGTLEIAGDVIRIPGDQLFADIAVKPNSTVIKDAIAQLVAQAQGKKVKTIKIHSSASNDTIQNTATFKTNVPQYKNWTDEIIQAADTEAEFTAQDLKSNPTGNRALAYIRGQKVAELLKNVDLLKGADIQFVYEIGGSGDDNQFANLEIMAMEDDTIEVLKGGTVEKTTKVVSKSKTTKDNSYTTTQYPENIIDIKKAYIKFDQSSITKEVVSKKKRWPPSEWFKSKKKRTTTVVKGNLTKDQKIAKQKNQSQSI